MATAFACMGFLSGLNERILERREQKCAKPTAIDISALALVRFQYLQEKILREVFRVFH